MSIDVESVKQLLASVSPKSLTSDAEDIAERKSNQLKADFAKISKARRQFLGEYSYGGQELDSSELYKLRQALSSGKYARPSEYVATLGWYFGRFVPENRRQEVLEAVDRCLTQPYCHSWERRALRSSDMAAYADRIRLVLNSFAQDVLLPYDLAGLLTGNVPPEVTKYLGGQSWYHRHASLPCRIAGALDRGDAQVEEAVRELLMGEGKAVLLRETIEGVIQSGRSDMHELLGRLLLAARLQEGLRQVICENADMGTESAFMTLLHVIEENNLIRFSAVKRAVGVWLGLISDESGDLERVSGKSVALIRQCLTDEAFRKECLAGEDSMGIHIALWAIGFHDVQEAVRRAAELALHGTHHQRLTCGYFITTLNNAEAASRLARQVIAAFPEEMDTLALYLPFLMHGVVGRFWAVNHSKGAKPALTSHFADEAECRRMIDLLTSVRSGLKKSQIFAPCVFPWYSVRLDKALLTEKILCAAALTEDDALIDSFLPLLPECPVDDRDNLLRYFCGDPKTPARRLTLLNALCDKGEWVRRRAAEMMEKLTLIPSDVPVLEGLLRFKYADVRPKLIGLLLNQGDDELLGSITRLISDKTEERRIAALNMVRAVVKSGKRPSLAAQCRPLISAMNAPTAREKPLLESVRSLLGDAKAEEAPAEALCGPEDVYEPKAINPEKLQEALAAYERYFPGSQVPQELSGRKAGLLQKLFSGKPDMTARDQAQKDIASLTEMVISHAGDPVRNFVGEETTLGSLHDLCHDGMEGGVYLFPLWKGWFEEQLSGDPMRLMRACILANTRSAPEWAGDVQHLFGPGFHEETLHQQPTRTSWQVVFLLIRLTQGLVPEHDRHLLALTLLCWMAQCLPEGKLWRTVKQRVFGGGQAAMPFRALEPAAIVLSGLSCADESTFPTVLNAVMSLHSRSAAARKRLQEREPETSDSHIYAPISRFCPNSQMLPSMPLLLRGAHLGLLGRRTVYACLMNGTLDQRQGMMHLSLLSAYHRLQGAKPAADRWGQYARTKKELLTLYLGHPEPEGEGDAALLAFADEVCQPLLHRITDAEIRRGATDSDFTRFVNGVTRLDGAESFIAILAAMGKDKLIRTSAYYSMYASCSSRTECLCHLLRCCAPLPADTADTLRSLVQQYQIKPARLIEAALYVPAWIEMCEEALHMPGFTSAAYYFMAHMNEDFDDARMARIARYTPLTADELQNGAFDIAWFRSAFEALGEAQFDLVYDAAKYITDGAKHARARKYADAVLCRLDPEAVKAEIAEKRNKDLLRAYPLIPLKGEADVQARYLYLQQFLKESRSFGAQRAASEKTAVTIALQNLAMNAGYADAMRLTLRMETRLTEENAELFAPREIGDTSLRLVVDEQGQAAIECLKGGKALKSIPAKLKKDEYILRLTEMKKQLTEQHRRARRMLEESMENSSRFTAGEIAALMANPVIAPMLGKLVFMQGDRFGFTDGLTLTDEAGAAMPLNPEDTLVIAHPFHLWQAKKWIAFQQRLFDGRIVQPIRQVFRELYVKTPEELPRTTSLRYAGHQLQPGKTLACLKNRRWIADPEAGLQKVYYQENIVATIWALADWFSPADIESPTLEHVAFLDRKTGRQLAIREIPDVLFSEVMRDVDLAVSVAHTGGIDPECSHSTIEMRAALLAFTLPLFRLDNVRIEGSHAFIEGTLASYTVHLGSGVVHQRGGTMLSVLPVHSQHRGRLFLPFADDDPKTAEILSKVLLFAEDGRIKDPTILEQIIK